MIRFPALGLTAVLALALPVSAAGQVRLIPQVGLYAPTTELPSLDGAVDFGKRESSLAFGVAVELASLRVGVLHATEGEIPIDGVGCTDCARSTLTTATASLVIRPLPEIALVRPFVLLGGGVKRYGFTADDLDDEGVEAVLSDENDLTGHLGLGAELGLGGLSVLVEVQDLVSRFDAEGVDARFQHDLFFTIGVALGG
jgi:hypothetical protein